METSRSASRELRLNEPEDFRLLMISTKYAAKQRIKFKTLSQGFQKIHQEVLQTCAQRFDAIDDEEQNTEHILVGDDFALGTYAIRLFINGVLSSNNAADFHRQYAIHGVDVLQTVGVDVIDMTIVAAYLAKNQSQV